MIDSIRRIGSEESADGWFMINECVEVCYIEDDDGMRMDIRFDDKKISEDDAQQLALQLLENSIESAKKMHDS